MRLKGGSLVRENVRIGYMKESRGRGPDVVGHLR